MSHSTKEISTIVPGEDDETDREQLMKEIASELPDDDESEAELEIQPTLPSKKRFVMAFGGFVTGCLLLIVLVSWFFGIGFFSTPQPQPVNRAAKAENGDAPVTEEDKLRMALSMVAQKPASSESSPSESSPGSVAVETDPASPVNDLSVTPPPLSGAGMVLPEPVSSPSSSDLVSASKFAQRGSQAMGERPVTESSRKTQVVRSSASEIDLQANGRSVFFGRETKITPKVEVTPAPLPSLPSIETEEELRKAPFGTLLPIRLLGGVQTIGNSSGYVRMELTQPIEKDGFSYPAGTTIVGTLQRSESSRAYIAVVGLIDQSTGSLLKFTGDVLGSDGALGLRGRKRNVKSALSRTMAGLREVGTTAIGAIGNWRSGGTVLITDSSQKTSETLAGALSGKEKNSGEFVELTAGTTGYVLCTGH